jgi:hypothetical protein
LNRVTHEFQQFRYWNSGAFLTTAGTASSGPAPLASLVPSRPMRKGEAYREQGSDYLDKLEPERRTKVLIEELV